MNHPHFPFRYQYDENTRDLLAYFKPQIDGEEVLLGTVPHNIAQRSSDVFVWCEQRIALLGLK